MVSTACLNLYTFIFRLYVLVKKWRYYFSLEKWRQWVRGRIALIVRKANQFVREPSPIEFIWPYEGAAVGRKVVVRAKLANKSDEEFICHVYCKNSFISLQKRRTPILTFPFVKDHEEGTLKSIFDNDLPPGEYVLGIEGKKSKVRYVVRCICITDSRFNYAEYSAEKRRASGQSVAVSQLEKKLKFSLATTVYNTSEIFLEELFQTVSRQSYNNFEWLILDNGSSSVDTKSWLNRVSLRDSRIRVFSVDKNIHLIRGNRFLLDRANGEYFVPVDSDDLIYENALTFFSNVADSDSPDLIYSNEEKISWTGDPVEPLIRAEWSNLLALRTCSASHLMAFKRELAIRVGVYTDESAKGCHDWDTSLRFSEVTENIKKVNEVLYGWRMHAGSTSVNENAKEYIVDSHCAVLSDALKRRSLEHKFEIKKTSAFGFYKLVRKKIDLPKLTIFLGFFANEGLFSVLVRSAILKFLYPLSEVKALTEVEVRIPLLFRSWLSSDVVTDSERAQYINKKTVGLSHLHAYLPSFLLPTTRDWFFEAISCFEVDHKTAIVTGPVFDSMGLTRYLGYIVGLDGTISSPHYAKPTHSHYIQFETCRNISACYLGAFVFNPVKMILVGGFSSFDSREPFYGIELSKKILDCGFKLAFSPSMRSMSSISISQPKVPLSTSLNLSDRYYPRPLSQSSEKLFMFEEPSVRAVGGEKS